jgi:hypothetical protein
MTRELKAHEPEAALYLCYARNSADSDHRTALGGCDFCRADIVRLVDGVPAGEATPNGPPAQTEAERLAALEPPTLLTASAPAGTGDACDDCCNPGNCRTLGHCRAGLGIIFRAAPSATDIGMLRAYMEDARRDGAAAQQAAFQRIVAFCERAPSVLADKDDTFVAEAGNSEYTHCPSVQGRIDAHALRTAPPSAQRSGPLRDDPELLRQAVVECLTEPVAKMADNPCAPTLGGLLIHAWEEITAQLEEANAELAQLRAAPPAVEASLDVQAALRGLEMLATEAKGAAVRGTAAAGVGVIRKLLDGAFGSVPVEVPAVEARETGEDTRDG